MDGTRASRIGHGPEFTTVGPTLGAASLLAARAENLAVVALTMFGIGTALPLLVIDVA